MRVPWSWASVHLPSGIKTFSSNIENAHRPFDSGRAILTLDILDGCRLARSPLLKSLHRQRKPCRGISEKMSSNYDSKLNSRYSSFIHSELHMALSVTLSNIGQVNCHSLSHRHFQHMTIKVLFHTQPNYDHTSTTSLSNL